MFRTSLLGLLAASMVTSLGVAQTIRVEIDYMVDTDHSHQPQPEEIAAIVQMFACHGVTLIVEVDDAIPHQDILQCDDTDDSFFGCTAPSSFRQVKSAWFDNGVGWHYCVFGHQYDAGRGNRSSGIAEVGGDDLLVTLGVFTDQIGTPFDRASTFAHELGHNLGLRHFSEASDGDVGNFQPNYASIMSYQYQLTGIRTQMECLGLVEDVSRFKEIDYSDGRLPSLDEAALSEVVGVGIHQVDWNCNGIVDLPPVTQGVDSTGGNWCADDGPFTVLRDHDDWSHIELTGVYRTDAESEVATCITRDEVEALRQARLADPSLCSAAQPVLRLEACQADMIWVDADHSGSETGTGDRPYNDLLQAHDAAADGSVLYLQPGTFGGTGGPITLGKNLVLAGPGGAVIDP